LPANRWFQRTWLSVVLVATGLGMLVVSWGLPQAAGWWSSVLIEIGVTVMLLVPLLLLTGVVERQFRGVRPRSASRAGLIIFWWVWIMVGVGFGCWADRSPGCRVGWAGFHGPGVLGWLGWVGAVGSAAGQVLQGG
jgi:hypothetical protein